jgi:hypothetical protein
MASNDLKSLVEQFATQLESIVTRRANEAFAAKFDAVKAQLVGGSTPSRTVKVAATAPKGRVGRPAGSRNLGPAAEKPCPVCGKMNKGRRFSYLCEDHRSKENLSKFKGAARKGAPAAAPAAKRGPGRPRKTPAPAPAAASATPAAAPAPAATPAAAPAPVAKRGPGRPRKTK